MKYYTSIPVNASEPVGLNTSLTGTMASTSDRPLPGTAQIPPGFTSQYINDAMERNNTRFVDWDRLNEQLQ